jgi:hypothetical protein
MPEQFEEMVAYRAAVTELAESFRGRLDDAALAYVIEFIEYNENGEALSNLAWLVDGLTAGAATVDERQRLSDLAYGLEDNLPPSYDGMMPSPSAWWLDSSSGE